MSEISIRKMLGYSVFIQLLFVTSILNAQPVTGVGAGFGVDGGLYTGYLEYPLPAVTQSTDDWFKGTGSGVGVIDESDTLTIRALLQGAGDPLFIARMSHPQSSVNNGRIWIDALYARDNFGGTGFTDATAYTTASKNGQDPAVWSGGTANVLGKNDIIDVAGHMRRDGESLETGNLWFYGLAVIAEPGGASYLDFEFFNEEVTYSAATGFTSGGTDMGHTAFDFSVDWKISKVGDFIFSTDVTSSGMETVDMRIWVSYVDFNYISNNATPNLDFDFTGDFDGPYNGSPYGYAKILPKSSNFGQTNSTLAEAPPWGHKGTKFNLYSSSSLGEYAVMEMGVNLTEFGIDHVSIEGVDACDFPINTFLIKTRSSASFTAQLKDFGGPYEWGRTTIDAIIIGETVLSCLNPNTILAADPIRNDATYSWSTNDGTIDGPMDTTHIHVTGPGTYRLDMWVLLDDVPGGCKADYAEKVVGYDPSKPFFQDIEASSTFACNGSNGSITLTFSGGNPPYTYLWSNGATTQNLSNLSSGTYTVTISDTEGCEISDSAEVYNPTPMSITPTSTNLTCYGEPIGSVSLSVTGSTPFTYAWSTGGISSNITSLSAGTYTVTITDKDNCSSIESYTITQPSAITKSIVKVDATNNDDPGNGSITLTVGGGTSPFTFNWAKNKDAVITNPYAATQNLSLLTRGIYTVTITDDNSCSTTISASIYEPEICNDGKDNDGDGLTDCDDGICIPAAPGLITASDDSPCVSDVITYSVVNNPALTGYTWTAPSNATINSGQGSHSISLTWNSDLAGQLCVKANALGCYSTPVCKTVNPAKTPDGAQEIDIINN